MRRKSEADYLVDEHGCWIWQLAINSAGYGLKWDKDRKCLMLAHRWHYERARGPVPAGRQVDHLCNVRICVNPAHLEAVTPKVNVERMRQRNGYEPLTPPAQAAPAVRSVDPADCLLWQGCIDRDGYGAKSMDGRRVMVHRWAYEQVHGPIEPHLQIDHLCRNRACYQVDHLEAVTGPENNRRRWLRGCKRGHPFTPENTLWFRDGRRKCRTCDAARRARYEQRRKRTKPS